MGAFVTIAEFIDTASAHLARSFLESEGIPAFLLNENIVGINWGYSVAVGGVKLQVPQQEAERAAELLRSDAAVSLADWAAAMGEETGELEACVAPLACPQCGSNDLRPRMGLALSALLPFLLCFICAPAKPKGMRCKTCGHFWK